MFVQHALKSNKGNNNKILKYYQMNVQKHMKYYFKKTKNPIRYKCTGMAQPVTRVIAFSHVQYLANIHSLADALRHCTLYCPGFASISLVFITSTGCVMPVAIVP